MKRLLLWIFALILLLGGCIYQVPLSEHHEIAIDRAALGMWHSGQDGEQERMLVLRYSDTEYLVHYPVGDDADYYRAWQVAVEDMQLIQLELLGDEDGPVAADKQDLYAVASFQVSGDQLQIAMLNPQVVSDKITSSTELRQSLLAARNDPKLFDEPVSFTRTTGKQ